MSNYYVSGCIDVNGDVSRCDDSAAQFWTLYHRNDDGLSEGIIDCVFREDAEAAMRAYEERDALAADEGYKQAFYEIADIIGIGARPDSPKDVFEQVIKPMLINLTKESGQLATENASLLTRLRNIIDIVSKADNRYCMCGESMDSHSLGGCGSPIGMLDYHFGKLTDENPETPATDAYLNSVRAELIPEGYVIVPQQMHLSADAMESLCFHCGDGGFAFGDFTDGILWVGNIENDDGTKTYGLNIATAEYPEEGSANISEFATQLRAGDPS